MKYIELEFEQLMHFSLLLFKSKSHSSNSLSLSLSLLILFSSFSSKSSNDSPVKENEVGITFGIIYLILGYSGKYFSIFLIIFNIKLKNIIRFLII